MFVGIRANAPEEKSPMLDNKQELSADQKKSAAEQSALDLTKMTSRVSRQGEDMEKKSDLRTSSVILPHKPGEREATPSAQQPHSNWYSDRSTKDLK